MYYLIMPLKTQVRVVKPTAVNVLREGIEQAKAAHAPREMINNLEDELVAAGLFDLFQMQNQPQN